MAFRMDGVPGPRHGLANRLPPDRRAARRLRTPECRAGAEFARYGARAHRRHHRRLRRAKRLGKSRDEACAQAAAPGDEAVIACLLAARISTMPLRTRTV